MSVPEQSESQQIICEGYEFSFQCPNNFWDLDATEVDNARYCNECQRKVFLCDSPEDVSRHESEGHCIAVSRITEGTPRRVMMGIVEPVPDVTDSDISLHNEFTAEIDLRITAELRREGFSGPRSQLVKESDSFVETINIVTSAARSECRLSQSFSFPEIRDMHPLFRVSTYWQTYSYGSDDFASIAQECVDAFLGVRLETKKELERIHSAISKMEIERLPRPLSKNPQFEKYFSDHHMAWLFYARGNTKLADALARRSLEKLSARCNRMLGLLQKDLIDEHEFVAKFLDGYDEESLHLLIWGWGGDRILPLDEVFSAMPRDAREILRQHEPFLTIETGP